MGKKIYKKGIIDVRENLLLDIVCGEKNVALGTEKITNGDMELDSNWADFEMEEGDVNEQSSTKAYEGTYSRHVSGNSNDAIKSDDFQVEEGKVYRISAMVYVVSGTVLFRRNSARCDFNIYSSTTGQWEELTVDAIASESGYEAVRFHCSGGDAEFYVDQVSFKEVTEIVDKSEKGGSIVMVNEPSRVTNAGLGGHPVLDLDGTDQLIQTADQDYFDADEFTAIALFKMDELDQTFKLFAKKNDGTPSERWSFGMDGDNKLEFEANQQVGGASSFKSDEALEADKWYLVAVTVDGDGNAKMYINNDLQTNNDTLTALIASDDLLTMGALDDSTDLLNGKIGMFRMYSTALSAEQLDIIYRWCHQKFGVLTPFKE